MTGRLFPLSGVSRGDLFLMGRNVPILSALREPNAAFFSRQKTMAFPPYDEFRRYAGGSFLGCCMMRLNNCRLNG